MGEVLTPGSVAPPPGAGLPERPDAAPAPGTVLPSHYAQCMGCGADHPTGLRLRMVVGEGWTVHADVTLGEHHQGAPGLAHGGMLAAALDEALGGLGWLLQAPMVTGRLQVEYLRPVRIGTTVRIVAQAVAVQGRRTYCQAYARDVADLDGGDLARAFAVFVLVPLEHFRRHGRSMPTTARTWEVNP